MIQVEGNWTVGSHDYCVVTNQRPEGYIGNIEKEKWELNEIQYYGGYLVCESIISKDAAKIIAAAPSLYKACDQILRGLDQIDISQFFEGIMSARKALESVNPPMKRIEEFSNLTLSRINSKVK